MNDRPYRSHAPVGAVESPRYHPTSPVRSPASGAHPMLGRRRG